MADDLYDDEFNLDDDKGNEEELTLVYGGKEVKVKKEEAVKLAQQGMDYTKKMQKIAPYKKLVELLEADPAAVEHLNGYFKKKLGVGDADNTTNSDKGDEKVVKPVVTGDGGHAMFLQTLKATNENYDNIMTEVAELVSQEPLKVQMLADSDVDTFMKYFNKAKKNITTKKNEKLDGLPKIESGNSFVLPGLEKETTADGKAKKVWEMNSKDFRKALNKISGYE